MPRDPNLENAVTDVPWGGDDWLTPRPVRDELPADHWHRSDQLLTDIIRNGGGSPETRMPAFASVLSDRDVDDVLEYLKANWGQQERALQWQMTWQETNRDTPP